MDLVGFSDGVKGRFIIGLTEKLSNVNFPIFLVKNIKKTIEQGHVQFMILTYLDLDTSLAYF